MNGVDAVRVPEVEAQLVFAIERGSCFEGGQSLTSGLRACLFLQPPHLTVIEIPSTIREAVGVSLKPTGLRLAVGRASSDLWSSARIALDELWGEQARELLERLVLAPTAIARRALLEASLLTRARSVSMPSRSVVRALAALEAAHGDVSFENLTRSCGGSVRGLRSALIRDTGLQPKSLARILRIRRALELLAAEAPLSQAALAAAFADQAHMSREFRNLVGPTPSGLRQRLSQPQPSQTTNRDLLSTGLLVMAKS